MSDGCVHLLYNSSMEFHQLAARQLLSGQSVRCGKGGRYGPSITYTITPAGPLSSSRPGGPPRWASPLVFVLIGIDSQKFNPTRPKEKSRWIPDRFFSILLIGCLDYVDSILQKLQYTASRTYTVTLPPHGLFSLFFPFFSLFFAFFALNFRFASI